MLHDASFPFLITGLVSILIGSAALVGGSAPLGTLAQWVLPLLLIGLGVAGVAKVWRRSA